MSKRISRSVRKQQVMKIIKDYTDEHPYSPTLDEIAQACNPPYANAGAVSGIVNELVEEGHLGRDGRRSLHILQPLEEA